MKADDTTLATLMARAQAGDGAAYRAVLTWSKDWLKRYYARRIASDAIDDLVQDTLLSVHAKRASFDPSRPFLPWLAAIARFRWVDRLRRVYRADECSLDTDIACPAGDEAVMARISIDRMLAALPPGQSDAIRLVKIDGLSVVEASARSGQSESLIKVNIHRGLRKLAALVESE